VAKVDGQKLAEWFSCAAQAHQEGRYREACSGYEKILKRVPNHFDVLHLSGQALIQAGQPARAVRRLKQAVAVDGDNADAWYDLGLAYRRSGQQEQAVRAYRRTLAIEPDYLKAHLSLVEIRFPGEHYTRVLRKLHQHLRPATYMEIGVETGQSMALAEPATLCLGIDPEPRIEKTLPPRCEMFTLTSDAFFARFNVRELLGRQPLAFAFIDGLHVFEAALRDFVNIERLAAPDSVVAVHDCIPLDERTSARERTTNFWSGDVWKLVPCLKKYRPDLSLVSVAAKPTGLGLITGLDPENRVLEDRYEQIVAEYRPLGYTDIAGHASEALNIMPNDMRGIIDWLEARRMRAAS
jgi:tetratricopeptide (TPR) repeat protein